MLLIVSCFHVLHVPQPLATKPFAPFATRPSHPSPNIESSTLQMRDSWQVAPATHAAPAAGLDQQQGTARPAGPGSPASCSLCPEADSHPAFDQTCDQAKSLQSEVTSLRIEVESLRSRVARCEQLLERLGESDRLADNTLRTHRRQIEDLRSQQEEQHRQQSFALSANAGGWSQLQHFEINVRKWYGTDWRSRGLSQVSPGVLPGT